MKKLLLYISIFTIAFASCKKKNEVEPETSQTEEFTFSDLTAESTNIAVGGSTELNANATGSDLTYSWKIVDYGGGDILGSGSEVTYGASTCCAGTNKIECTVSDGASSDTKTITIEVE